MTWWHVALFAWGVICGWTLRAFYQWTRDAFIDDTGELCRDE